MSERNAVISNGISVVLNEDPNAPLVLLFGWAGCVDRYLAKYSEIYEKQRFIFNFFQNFFFILIMRI